MTLDELQMRESLIRNALIDCDLKYTTLCVCSDGSAVIELRRRAQWNFDGLAKFAVSVGTTTINFSWDSGWNDNGSPPDPDILTMIVTWQESE